MNDEVKQRLIEAIEWVMSGKLKKTDFDMISYGRISVYRVGAVVRCDIQSSSGNPEMN